jgi:hypothetical protein
LLNKNTTTSVVKKTNLEFQNPSRNLTLWLSHFNSFSQTADLSFFLSISCLQFFHVNQ